MESLDFPEAGFGAVQLSLRVKGHTILNKVDFHVVPGEIHALVGKQNEGKTAFCNILTGELKPTSGYLLAGGRPYTSFTPRLSRRLGIEYVGNHPIVFPDLSVAENIYTGVRNWWEGLWIWRSGIVEAKRWLSRYAIELPFDEPLRALRVEDWLFVQLINRLARKPRLLLLDETLEQLSPARFKELLPAIKDRLAEGMAVLWVTHKLEDAIELADRLTVLRQGAPLFSDRTENVNSVTLLRLSYSEADELAGEDFTRRQFYEMMRFVEAMLRDMPSAVVIYDLENKIRFINISGRELFDIPRSAGMGLREYLGEANSTIYELLDSVRSYDSDTEWHSVTLKTAAGEKLIDMRVRGIQEMNVLVGKMLVVEDVTAREHMRQELALSENLASVGLLAAGVAHEVNDPLAIISNYLGFIRDEPVTQEVHNAVTLAHEETVRIQQIVDNLVAFSGNRPRTKTYVDIRELVGELTGLLQFHANGREIRFEQDESEEPAFIDADANEMRQVFLNLFRNSMDAIEERGTIRTSIAVVPDAELGKVVRIVVSDTGKGIQLKNPDDVFKPFITTKKGVDAHQGLGLSIVYGIIEKYHGKISVRNLPEGGCQFRLVFPYCTIPTD